MSERKRIKDRELHVVAMGQDVMNGVPGVALVLHESYSPPYAMDSIFRGLAATVSQLADQVRVTITVDMKETYWDD